MAAKETTVDVQQRLLLEQQTREVADLIAGKMPGRGFLLMAFDFGDGGNLAYVSNAQRPDVLKVLEEWKQRSS